MAVTQKEYYKIDLAALHSIYERNYNYLKRLLPNIREIGYSRCIAFTNDKKMTNTVTFTVLENTPYTSYILFKQTNLLAWLTAPFLYIRCYHDAQLAEIAFAQNTRSFRGIYNYPNPTMHQPDEKKQINHFLEEWLSRCLDFGYDVKHINLVHTITK